MIWQFIKSNEESPKEKKNHSLLGTIFKEEKVGGKYQEKNDI